MASHQELVDELAVVNNMSTEDRLNYAQRRRTEQLVRWNDYEHEQNNRNSADGSKKSWKVKFGDCITLLEAAARNDYDEVQELFKQKIDANQANEDGLTALHQACIDNLEDIVELLLDNNADVNAVDSEYWTPLHAACTCGHTNIAEILIKRGADLLALNADHNMPYDICEEDETLEFIEQAMAKQGITQEQINDARSSRERLIMKDVEEYLNDGGNIDTVDEVGATILHVAAANGYVDLTRLFLLHTNNLNPQDKDGWTPLHAAACWCQMEIIQILGIEHNADPSIKNKVGEFPSDVTEDEEIKMMLQKMAKAQKDSRKKKLFHGLPRLNGKNSSTRASGLRGQSFKGRSKRDKKNGISAVEAKSESAFWHKGQETDMLKMDTSLRDDRSPGEKKRKTSPSQDNSRSDIGNNNADDLKSTSSDSNGVLLNKSFPSKKSGLFKLNLLSKKGQGHSSKAKHGETLSELKQRRSQAGPELDKDTTSDQPPVEPGAVNHYRDLNGSRKKSRQSCTIL